MKKFAILLSAAAFVPLGATAQEFSGSVTLGYGFGELKDFDQEINSLTLSGEIGIKLDDQWSIGLRARHLGLDIDGLPIDVSGNLLGANVAYAFGNGAWAGIYTENSELSVDLLPINFGVTDFGIEGGYALDSVQISGFVGASSDLTSYGLSARYSPVEGAEIGGLLMRSELDSDLLGDSISASAFGLAGAYTFDQGIGVFAGISRTSVSDADLDLNTFGLGASYSIEQATFSVEYAVTEIDLGGGMKTDLDTVRLGVTIPFGAKGSNVPLNSVAGAVLSPARNVLTQTAMTAF